MAILKHIASKNADYGEAAPLTREDEMAEFMFLGLRMTRGISKAEFERQFGSEIDAIYGDVLRKYKSMGLLLEEKGRIFLSREGIHVVHQRKQKSLQTNME